MADATAETRARPQLTEIARRGLLAVGLSVAVNVVVLAVAKGIFDLAPNLQALDWVPVIFLTVVGAVGATLVYAGLTRFTPRPDRIFTIVAGVVLVLSFLPDVLFLPGDPGATTAAIAALMLMHVVVAVICVAVLTR